MTKTADGPNPVPRAANSAENNDMLRGIEMAMEAGDMFWDALGQDEATVDEPEWEEDDGALTRTTTLSALQTGTLTPSLNEQDELGIRRSARPLGEQTFRRLSSTYFQDIANVEATDEVPTWDVRPEAPTSTLRGAFGDDGDMTGHHTSDVESWWQARANDSAPIHGTPEVEQEEDDDDAFCVEYTDEVPIPSPDDDDEHKTLTTPVEEPPPPPAPAQPPAVTAKPKTNMLLIAGGVTAVLGILAGIALAFMG